MTQRTLSPSELSSIRLNPSNIQTLDHLFTAVSAEELREDLLEMYHTYLIYCHNRLPVTFERMSRNMYHVIHCLAEMEKGHG
jgi:hypothetical protein